MSYFRLDQAPSLTCGHLELDARFKLHKLFLLKGARLDEKTFPAPWTLTVRPNPDHPFAFDAYYPAFHLMSRRMVQVLQEAQVSNLQIFPARITRTDTGETSEDHVVVNVVGMVAAADRAASESSPVADKQYFHTLAIDADKVRGLDLFRLEESRIDVIVSERVATALAGAALPNLQLLALA